MLLLILFLFASSHLMGLPNLALQNNLHLSDSLSLQQDSVHLVAKGETLYAIASKYGIKVSDLKNANQLKDSHIEVGQKLMLPIPLFEEVEVKDTIQSYQDSLYTVKKGDVLSIVAAKHQLDTEDLVKWNALESADKIYVGQEISLYPPINLQLDSLKVEIAQPKEILEEDSARTERQTTVNKVPIDKLKTDTLQTERRDITDVANNQRLAYDFTPSGIKTAINVFVLLLLLAIFIYNINK